MCEAIFCRVDPRFALWRSEGVADLSIAGRRVDDAGPDVSFDAWVAPHRPVLLGVAAREVGGADAEDVVQDAVLRAWQKRHTFDERRGSPRAWLLAIVLDRCRRHRVRRRLDVAQLSAAPADWDVDVRLDVEALVQSLPRRQRQVVTLHYLADLAVEEIAAVLGLSESSVKTHLSKGRRSLRKRWPAHEA